MTIQQLARACANATLAILDEDTLCAIPEAHIQAARQAVLQLIIAERATLTWPYDMEPGTTFPREEPCHGADTPIP